MDFKVGIILGIAKINDAQIYEHNAIALLTSYKYQLRMCIIVLIVLQTKPLSDCDVALSSNNSLMLAKEEVQVDLQITDISTKMPPQVTKASEFLDFISKLNLLDKYPQKLQLVDALSIHLDLLDTNNIPDDVNMLPYLILQKIMMYDNYRPLCKLAAESNTEFEMHPVDILLALLHCCDNILRQDLLSRLHICKLAIPFLLPDPDSKKVTLLLWAMRSIVCEWKCKINETVTPKESCIVDHEGPIISFLRVGKAKSPKDYSKSQILNSVIGEQIYFFHWNCPGGTYNRKFVDGLVELSCYLPSGKEIDAFSDAITFLNLRGEARHCSKQLDFIKKISFMIFVLFLEESIDSSILSLMQELAVLPGGLAIIFPNYHHLCTSQNSSSLSQIISEKKIVVIDIKDENEHRIRSKIQKCISQKLSDVVNLPQFSSISNKCVTIAQEIGIAIDEDTAESKVGKSLANVMIKTLNSVPTTDVKAQMLPLQGPELWHKWAKYDKENFRKLKKENATVAYFNETLEQNKKEIRLKQLYHAKHLSPLMESFINCLQTCKASEKKFILQWLKLRLDNCSRKILPRIHAEYKQIREQLQKVRNEGNSETSAVVKNLTNELKKKTRALIEGSVGLEHLFREIGQMYEAVKDCGKQHAVTDFPRIMVDILNQGYPIELMDGDASHIPITWVSAILDELKHVHKRKKLFVISVLGIQSTGKSTLLNAMFGLQFNVSAGRCTRGAFIQLLPVKSNKSIKPMCDYVLIVDTEGLRAPELSSTESVTHDNELATFAIGLADVAIINIYGEAPVIFYKLLFMLSSE